MKNKHKSNLDLCVGDSMHQSKKEKSLLISDGQLSGLEQFPLVFISLYLVSFYFFLIMWIVDF